MNDIIIYGETPEEVENTSSCDNFRRKNPRIFALEFKEGNNAIISTKIRL